MRFCIIATATGNKVLGLRLKRKLRKEKESLSLLKENGLTIIEFFLMQATCESNPCCSPITCKLKIDAECSSGPCCDNCRVRKGFRILISKTDAIFQNAVESLINASMSEL